ncbi:binding-protein-dependent transport systems inner membrane component [Methylobacterium sp. 4-46]|uniref:ABC transporter permease n=1 Tax=unclassified Methylobacterium TaxID=2615210 RepID=UPI000152CAB6|nr:MULTISPECIES: ABC transporter permease [Methylobacterium]ACA14966.1 binding-protein-dependent transport systems inner membrane component [Methylobacterium sp. 4-46]WFT80704.1 ABC transporter permease [Methylobacterium nodulans]
MSAADLTQAPPAAAGEAPVVPRRAPGLARLREPLLALAFPLALGAVWHLATVGRPYSLIPPPGEVWTELRDLAVGGVNDDAFSGTLLTHLAASVSRVLGGFGLAVLAALPLGLLIGRVPLVRQLLDPTFQILRPVPVTAWLPLAMILFGLGPRSACFLVFLGAFYPILVNTVFGVRSVEPRLFEAAAMLGCRGSAQFTQVVLPAALPSIFTGLRLGLGFAWVVIVVGEMTGVPTGLGAMIMEARQLSRTEIVICGMVVIGVAGFVSDRIVTLIGRRLLAWSPTHG